MKNFFINRLIFPAKNIFEIILKIIGFTNSLTYKWMPGSTKRICQMTGNYDPEYLPHYSYTDEWGVMGVDGAANTEFDGRTFIFFGDAAQAENIDIHFGDPTAFIEDAPFPRNACIAAAPHLQNQLNAFFIGMDGALYVTWVNSKISDRANWRGPFRVGPKNIAPPGGGIAAAHQTPNQLNVFFIGNKGLYVAWATDQQGWQDPKLLGPEYVAEPGAKIACAYFKDRLYVFYFGKNGQMYVHRVVGVGVWEGPYILGASSVAPSGAWIAPIQQTDNQLTVLFIGNDKKLNGYWLIDQGKDQDFWHGLGSFGAKQNVAPPGGCLAAIKQSSKQTTVVFFGNDRKLNVQWVAENGVWSDPIAMGSREVVQPGSAVALTYTLRKEFTKRGAKGGHTRIHAVFIDEYEQLMEYWVDGMNSWNGPIAIISNTGAPPGSPLVAERQDNQQTTVLHGGFDNDLNVSWASDSSGWGGPNRINPYMVKLYPVLQNNHFYPFTVQGIPPICANLRKKLKKKT